MTRASPADHPWQPDPALAGERLIALDILKGIAIALMVFGHALQGLQASGVAAREGFMFDFVVWFYGFHMHAFFFVAGALLALRPPGSFGELLRRRAGSLYYPYILWGVLYFFVAVAFARFHNHPIQNPGDLASHAWELVIGEKAWFLPTLFATTLVAWPLLRRSRLLALGCGLVLACLPLETPWQVVNGVGRFLLFLVLGCLTIDWLRRQAEPRGGGLLLAVGALLLGLAAIQPPPGSAWVLRLEGIGAGVLGVAGLLALSAALARLPGLARSLAYLGQASLVILLLHAMATGAARALLLHYLPGQGPDLYMPVMTLAGLGLPLLVYALVQRLGLQVLFAWPRGRVGLARL